VTQERKDKSWKEHLLSSGLPLEYAVKQSVARFDVASPAEFNYFRKNEAGQSTEFSVDIHASLLNTSSYFVDLFIECKYRHDSVRWVFTPEPESTASSLSDVLTWMDSFAAWRVNHNLLRRARRPFQSCGKGIELLPDGTNPKTIRQAVDQLRYAFASSAADAITHQRQHLLGPQSPVFAYLPIVVTTAQIWRLRDSCSLDGIRGAKDIEQVADRESVIVLHECPSNELKVHTRHTMTTFLSNEDLLPSDSIKRSIHHLADQHPRHFLVVEFTHLPGVMRRINTLLRKADLFVPVEKPGSELGTFADSLFA
jgi:hypothetical protein